jgi:hypothetical protein
MCVHACVSVSESVLIYASAAFEIKNLLWRFRSGIFKYIYVIISVSAMSVDQLSNRATNYIVSPVTPVVDTYTRNKFSTLSLGPIYRHELD